MVSRKQSRKQKQHLKKINKLNKNFNSLEKRKNSVQQNKQADLKSFQTKTVEHVEISIPLPANSAAGLPSPEAIKAYRDAGCHDMGNRALAMAEKSQEEQFKENRRKYWEKIFGKFFAFILTCGCVAFIFYSVIKSSILGSSVGVIVLTILKIAIHFAKNTNSKYA